MNVFPVVNLLGFTVMNASPPVVQCARINGINILVDEVIPLRCEINYDLSVLYYNVMLYSGKFLRVAIFVEIIIQTHMQHVVSKNHFRGKIFGHFTLTHENSEN